MAMTHDATRRALLKRQRCKPWIQGQGLVDRNGVRIEIECPTRSFAEVLQIE